MKGRDNLSQVAGSAAEPRHTPGDMLGGPQFSASCTVLEREPSRRQGMCRGRQEVQQRLGTLHMKFNSWDTGRKSSLYSERLGKQEA